MPVPRSPMALAGLQDGPGCLAPGRHAHILEESHPVAELPKNTTCSDAAQIVASRLEA